MKTVRLLGSWPDALAAAASSPATLFGMPGGFVAEMPESGSGVGHKLWAAALDEVAGFGDDIL